MKQTATRLLRKLHLLSFADRLRFLASAAQYRRHNKRFVAGHRDIVLPPPYMLYESFGKLDYRAYYEGGRESATRIVDMLKKHADLTNARVCEWGCGPARLLRHVPDLLGPERCTVYGSDYNQSTIAWCRSHIDGIEFSENGLMPPLVYPDGHLDAVFCVSVFTHLSRAVQDAWLKEIIRVLRPGGVFLMTVHGDSCIDRLSADETRLYRDEGCVVRGEVTEGGRVYTAYNSPAYMRDVFLKEVSVLEFIPGGRNAQDVWIVKTRTPFPYPDGLEDR